MHNLYQDQQIVYDKVLNHLKTSDEPTVADLCVAFGKTLLIAHLARHVINKGGQVLSMAHTQELLEGAAAEYGAKDCAVYCSSLNRKELDKPLIYASPQSLVGALKQLPKIHFLIIDEAHFINDKNKETVYMRIIKHVLAVNPRCRILGLTGTPYRLEKGKINLIVGKKRLFKSIVAEVYIKDLLAIGGRLTKPITPHDIKESYDYSGLKMKMGKYQDCDLNKVALDERLTKSIIRNFVQKCETRNKCLIFASTLQHAKEIQKYITEFGYTCGYIDGQISKADRRQQLERFNNGINKFMVNKDLLGTGYNEKAIDAIAILRPSESRSLIIQFLGRALRVHESKKDALICDYANNFDDLNELLSNEDIQAINQDKNKEPEQVIICPECGALCSENAHKCKVCNFYFISKTCDQCETEQSISNRHCISCKCELVDPNQPLSISASGKEYFRGNVSSVVLSTHVKNKKCLRLDYLIDSEVLGYPTATQFFPQSSSWLLSWIKKHMTKKHDDIATDVAYYDYVDNVDNIVRDKRCFVLPTVINFEKKGKYYNVK